MNSLIKKFKLAKGNLMGVANSDNNYVVRWQGDNESKILFSFAKRGNAISAHFASDKKGLRYLKEAIDDFCNWAFFVFSWCTMVLAFVNKPSVGRLITKCGFNEIATHKQSIIYMRANHG